MKNIHLRLRKIVPIILFGSLLLAVGLLSLRRIHLVTADLGRHIANGRSLLTQGSVIDSNFYSYSFPETAFVNHHWASGLVFYWLHQAGGFLGLSYLHMALTTTAFGLIFLLSWRLTSILDTILASLVVLPLVVARTEVRPEVFSYALVGIFFFILSGWRTRRIREEWLSCLPLLMILWVNLHIYFFMGLLLIGAFGLDIKDKKRLQDLAIILGLTAIATFVNPLSWKIALYPLRIFENYGYMIAENQSVPFFWKREMTILGFGSFHAATLGLGISLGLLALLKTRYSRAFVVVGFIAWGLALSAIRNFALFGLCAIPVMAMVGYILDATRLRTFWRIGLILLAVSGQYYDWSRAAPAIAETWGPGLAPGAEQSAIFFKQQGLKGPIFNNYDIGGYLIYHLFPEEKVFVDNRPEAYPQGFFEKTYIPMQENHDFWVQLEAKYQFNTIFYYIRDNTPAGQSFLIARVQDPEWVPVYVDQDAIIFVRKKPKNQNVIDRFALPPEMFRVSPAS
jgi:hypothetical protein